MSNESAGSPIVVLGASGMLGSALTRDLAARGVHHAAPTSRELDLSGTGVGHALEALRPAAVINAAAFTDVAKAERAEVRAGVFRINRDAPAEVAGLCRRLGIPLIHVSTDYVFDGKAVEPYREDAPTSPTQVYGLSKLEGELAVRSAHPDALIARTSTLFGSGARKRPHYVDAILRQAKTRATLEVVRLPVSSPTYADDLAGALVDLLEAAPSGIVHTVNDGACSRLELARETIRLAGLADAAEVIERPEDSSSFERPAYSALDISYLAGLIGRRLRRWDEALAAYVASQKSQGFL